jgi:hypothetical protein
MNNYKYYPSSKFIDEQNKLIVNPKNPADIYDRYVAEGKYELARDFGRQIKFDDAKRQAEWVNFLNTDYQKNLNRQVYINTLTEEQEEAFYFAEAINNNYVKPLEGGDNKYYNKFSKYKNAMFKDSDYIEIEFDAKKQYGWFGWDWLAADNNDASIEALCQFIGVDEVTLQNSGVNIIKQGDNKPSAIRLHKNNKYLNEILVNLNKFDEGSKHVNINRYNLDNKGKIINKENIFAASGAEKLGEADNAIVSGIGGGLTLAGAVVTGAGLGASAGLGAAGIGAVPGAVLGALGAAATYGITKLVDWISREAGTDVDEMFEMYDDAVSNLEKHNNYLKSNTRQYSSYVLPLELPGFAELDAALANRSITNEQYKNNKTNIINKTLGGIFADQNFGNSEVYTTYNGTDPANTVHKLADQETKTELFNLLTSEYTDILNPQIVVCNGQVGLQINLSANYNTKNGQLTRQNIQFNIYNDDLTRRFQHYIDNNPKYKAAQIADNMNSLGQKYVDVNDNVYECSNNGFIRKTPIYENGVYKDSNIVTLSRDELISNIENDVLAKETAQQIYMSNVNSSYEIADEKKYNTDLKLASVVASSELHQQTDVVQILNKINNTKKEYKDYNSIVTDIFTLLDKGVSNDILDKLTIEEAKTLQSIEGIYQKMNNYIRNTYLKWN